MRSENLEDKRKKIRFEMWGLGGSEQEFMTIPLDTTYAAYAAYVAAMRYERAVLVKQSPSRSPASRAQHSSVEEHKFRLFDWSDPGSDPPDRDLVNPATVR